MKKIIYFTLILMVSCGKTKQEGQTQANNTKIELDSVIDIAGQHLSNAIKAYPDPDQMPRSIHQNGKILLVSKYDWTSGFFPGSLWKMYELTADEKWKAAAIKWTSNLETIKNFKETHDIGFMIYCSYGNGYQLTNNAEYKDVIVQTARTLITRVDPEIGCILSWDPAEWNKKWAYPVIIDNMMNLELLYAATRFSGDSTFYKVAYNHAERTLKNHFRDDNSSFHVLDYDSLTGKVLQRTTSQGANDSSSWARGQAWGLYGFTVTARETGDKKFLNHAINIASYIMNHPSIDDDKVPYWDYFAPGIPDAPRDASAAAITASALLDLSKLDTKNSETYIRYASKIIESLSSDKYLAKPGTNNHFLLMHCTGNKPVNSEVDVPLNYADYYFLEALIRYRNLKGK